MNAAPGQPHDEPVEPGVVFWYRLYCLVLIFAWVVVAPLAIWSNVGSDPYSIHGVSDSLPPQFNSMFQEMENERKFQATLITLLVCALAVFPVVALCLKPTPGAWSYHIFVLVLGLGGCTLPFVVLMLIYWFQPSTQAYFGRGDAHPSAPSPPEGTSNTSAGPVPRPATIPTRSIPH